MKFRFLTLYAVVFMFLLYLPVLLLPLFSFNDSTIVSFPIKGFTTHWYETLMKEEPMLRSLVNSLKVACATAFFSTLLGICGARAVTRYNFFAKKSITAFVMLPLVLPEIIIAISLLVVLLRMGFDLSLFSVTLGHILMTVPFAMAVLISSFEGFDKSLEEASMDLGEGPLMTFFRVTLPMVAPGIVSSLLITFTISLDEFIVAFFLSGTEPTLPIYIWGQLRFTAKLPTVVALGSCLLISSFLLLWMAEFFRRRVQKRTGIKESVL